MSKPPFEFDTLALHAGQRPDAETGARATPIYQSASFVFESAEAAAGLFNLERTGHVYSRLSNPTNAVLEERIAVLDQGVGAVAVASGQAAMHLAVATLMGAGDHIVASRNWAARRHFMGWEMVNTHQSSPALFLFMAPGWTIRFGSCPRGISPVTATMWSL